MHRLVSTILESLKGVNALQLPAYERIITHAMDTAPPPFAEDWFGRRYLELAKDPEWFANSLVANAALEGYGATQIWKFSNRIPIDAYASEVRKHALDESRHSTMFVDMLETVFPWVTSDEDTKRQLNKIQPSFAQKGHPPIDLRPEEDQLNGEVLLNELIQVHITEIRALVLQHLLRSVVLEYCPPSSKGRLAKYMAIFIRDEAKHIRYTAEIFERAAVQGHFDFLISTYEARLRDFNDLTLKELERDQVTVCARCNLPTIGPNNANRCKMSNCPVILSADHDNNMRKGLDLILYPRTAADFFSGIWEKKAIHVSRNDPEYFSLLRDAISIEEAIWSCGSRWGDVSLARANTDHAKSPYHSRPASLHTVADALADGYTLVLNSLQAKNAVVAMFCRELEKKLMCNVGVNLYKTPGSSTGLDHHYDDEDVFILQLGGRKMWKIFEHSPELPLATSEYRPVDITNTKFIEFDLREGDTLYIPRGLVHQATSHEEGSTHLTVSIQTLRWVDLLQRHLQALAEEHIELRRGVPLHEFCVEKVVKEGLSLLAISTSDGVSLGETALRAIDGLLASKNRLPGGEVMARRLQNLRGAMSFSIAPDQVFQLCESSSGLVLKFIGASINVSRDLEPVIRCICKRTLFSLDDLPDDITLSEKRALAHKLVNAGFLVPVSPARTGGDLRSMVCRPSGAPIGG